MLRLNYRYRRSVTYLLLSSKWVKITDEEIRNTTPSDFIMWVSIKLGSPLSHEDLALVRHARTRQFQRLRARRLRSRSSVDDADMIAQTKFLDA